ncbi:hypothetical protein [Brevibacillus formosus]|nr:hypothetical protein [Brevibacillus formosus]
MSKSLATRVVALVAVIIAVMMAINIIMIYENSEIYIPATRI